MGIKILLDADVWELLSVTINSQPYISSVSCLLNLPSAWWCLYQHSTKDSLIDEDNTVLFLTLKLGGLINKK